MNKGFCLKFTETGRKTEDRIAPSKWVQVNQCIIISHLKISDKVINKLYYIILYSNHETENHWSFYNNTYHNYNEEHYKTNYYNIHTGYIHLIFPYLKNCIVCSIPGSCSEIIYTGWAGTNKN